jgi:ADP-ribose pyrophosphatase YjhB (NUDIX family)
MVRAAVVIEKGGQVALIERVRDGGNYYVFPGGGTQDGEAPEHAASREAREELGVDVDLGGLIFVSHREGREQRYYSATVSGGTFGTGRSTEMTTSGKTAKGTYVPVWLPLSALTEVDVRPKEISDKLAS